MPTYIYTFIQIRFLDFRENHRIVVARSSPEWQQESKQHKHMSHENLTHIKTCANSPRLDFATSAIF